MRALLAEMASISAEQDRIAADLDDIERLARTSSAGQSADRAAVL